MGSSWPLADFGIIKTISYLPERGSDFKKTTQKSHMEDEIASQLALSSELEDVFSNAGLVGCPFTCGHSQALFCPY